MDLAYEHNGLINHQRWYQRGISTAANDYYFGYDDADRLTEACYGGISCNSSALDVTYDYDKSGNIGEIDRRSNTGSQTYYDHFHVTGTNKLKNVYVNGLNKLFTHDAMGNMVANEVQGLDHATYYGGFNQPAWMVAGGSALLYSYDADGMRISRQVVDGTRTHYVRGAYGETMAVYEGGTRSFVNLVTPSGAMLGTYDGTERRYYLKDHLGSIRTTVDQSGNIDGYDDYYPFGLTMPGRSSNTGNPNDNYKFTGYELDDEAGLNVYHAGARGYDPVLGRFMQIDRFYHKYPSLSTYQYTANNPISFIDVNGDSVITYTEEEARAIVNDVNRIFEKKYGVSDALTFSSTSRDGKDAFLITANADSDFNWEEDAYTKELNTLMGVEADLVVQITDLNDGYGGGLTKERGLVLLDNDLSTFGDSGTEGYTASKHTVGGVFLHEALYHSTPLGQIESKYWGRTQATINGLRFDVTGPNWMRLYYGIRRSVNAPDHRPAPSRVLYKRN